MAAPPDAGSGAAPEEPDGAVASGLAGLNPGGVATGAGDGRAGGAPTLPADSAPEARGLADADEGRGAGGPSWSAE
eukprot:1412678-Alexandrium_andersonii.AAC.1